ncbi:MAG TPA: GWxTD domain-containing protein [Bacteroidales bacterium]|jgi:GWxTD domain-containing protein|nr:GWxTD domain-containing protein [Bacteroidales bacterium]MDI9574164.1 GWxTD domain-containing protein [Bacteroidota bacterium]OQC61519.1 MAG: hypothetical protein BWX51_00442 [Bacteroidetes bacterium ADurb.Bin012]MBP9511999.1 GWxTD domain-containing protein [Bacteroidales bacterium]MBP9588618.1 GWxTD domain-containing protein [Bacteroidales bacterium]
MKKFLYIVLLLITVSYSTFAKKLQASLNYATFYSPVDGPYIETYFSVNGNSVVFAWNENGLFRATIEIAMIFRQDEKIVNFKKYELLSPEIRDTTSVAVDFIDQQRIPLPVGKYDFELSITDKNNRKESYVHHIPIEIYYSDTSLVISGIQLVESYNKSEKESILNKNGYELVPKVSTFFSSDQNKLIFYAEIYNAVEIFGEGQKFLVRTYISNYESGFHFNQFSKVKRMDAENVNVVFNEFNITRLPSGNFNLVIEARDRQNRLVSINTLFFQRSNPGYIPDLTDIDSLSLRKSFASHIKNPDTLREYIKCLRPIAADYEKFFIDKGMKDAPVEVMQSYLYSFWKNRSETDPEGAFKAYLEEVAKVQTLFGTSYLRGYNTDRGRIFLQYGPPDVINDYPFDAGLISTLSDNEINKDVGGSVPYQIWHYYQIKDQRNKFFVFYNPHLIPNNYQLLHSDVKGEIYNPVWQSELHRIPFINIDAGNPSSNPNPNQ